MSFLDPQISKLPADSLPRRLGYAAMLTVGILATAYTSYLFNLVPIIPMKVFPDARLFFLLVSSAFLSFQAMGGSARRRAIALWGVLGYVIAFHLEEATVHWIGAGSGTNILSGSITGTRVGIPGMLGSILAVTAIILMHIESERCRLREDAIRRGAKEAGADALADGLAREGRRQTLGIAAAVSGFTIFLFIAEKPFGNSAAGGSWVLLVGGGVLIALALFLLRMMPGAAARKV